MADKLFCTSCNYAFKPRINGKAPSRCPYCDKEGTLEPVKSMQEWIDDVESEMN